MIRDDFLVFGEDARPPAFPMPTKLTNPGAPGTTIGWTDGMEFIASPFATGYTGTVNSYDLKVLTKDLGAGGRPLKAVFTVTTAFVDPNAAANDQNLSRFCVLIGTNATLSSGAYIIARSGGTGTNSVAGFSAGVLVAKFHCEILIPRLDTLARLSVDAKRYIGLAMEHRVPVADYTAGGVDARIVIDTGEEQFGNIRKQPVGYVVQ